MASGTSYEIEIRNIHLGAVLNEKSSSMGAAKRIQLGCRDADDQPVGFRMSVIAGGTNTGPYINIAAGSVFFEADIDFSQKLYFASKTENAVVEIMIWR